MILLAPLNVNTAVAAESDGIWRLGWQNSLAGQAGRLGGWAGCAGGLECWKSTWKIKFT